MVITLEQPPQSGVVRFKLNQNQVSATPVTPMSPPLQNQSSQQPVPFPVLQPLQSPQVVQPSNQAAELTTTKNSAPTKTDRAEFKNETGIQKALRQLEESYVNLKESVNLKKFDATKIEEYITKAEKRTGLPYSVEEKEQFRLMAKSSDPDFLKLLCMELHVGLSEKAEKEAMAALGRLILHRNQTDALKAYMDMPGKDANIKAYIRTVLMMHRVENWMNTVEDVKRKVKKPFQWLVPAVQHQQPHQHQAT
jgi:hypothetical protein